jgi:hypothetical protein
MHRLEELGKFLRSLGLTGLGVVSGGGGRGAHLAAVDPPGEQLSLVEAPATEPRCHRWDSHITGAPPSIDTSLHMARRRPVGHSDIRLSRVLSAHEVEGSDSIFDFVYLCPGDQLRYRSARDELRRWYPKVRRGGALIVERYLDGIWEDTVHGTKTAVDELAAEHELQVRVTFDTPPAWFVVKPRADRQVCRLDIALLTAFDGNQREVAAYTTPNKAAYCARHGYPFIVRTDGFAPSRPPAWSKIRFIKNCLREHEWVFWSDADSLIMNGSARLEEFVDEAYDLILTHEDMGVGVYNVCTGEMFFRRSKWSIRFLDEIWSQREFIHDRLWENRALIHLLWASDLSPHVQIVTQRRFNSYPSNYRKGDFMLHAAGLSRERQLRTIQKYHQFAVI